MMCVDGRWEGSVQAGKAVVAKQADRQERNECREEFGTGWKCLSVLMIVSSRMILGTNLMKGRKK
jgi:hypothetical protein